MVNHHCSPLLGEYLCHSFQPPKKEIQDIPRAQGQNTTLPSGGNVAITVRRKGDFSSPPKKGRGGLVSYLGDTLTWGNRPI